MKVLKYWYGIRFEKLLPGCCCLRSFPQTVLVYFCYSLCDLAQSNPSRLINHLVTLIKTRIREQILSPSFDTLQNNLHHPPLHSHTLSICLPVCLGLSLSLCISLSPSLPIISRVPVDSTPNNFCCFFMSARR